MIGARFGHYEVLAKIGEGGMGEVYRVRDTKLDREVAIKVLPEHSLDSADARSRFEREAKAVAALSHPNILAIHDFGEHEGTAYAVTELLEGESLAERLEEGPLPPRKAVELAGQMADGLAAAHEKGIVHRDLKPANVFLLADGRLKILDFGLAKSGTLEEPGSLTATLQQETSPGTVMGTVRYMSPEQAKGTPVDHRSDIFSFGAVLWEMLSGQAAFRRDSAVETMGAILKEDPGGPSATSEQIPSSVDRVIRRCLEKKPEHRFQSAQDLAFALRNSLDTSSHSMPELPAMATERASRLRPALAALALLMIGGVVGAWIHARVQTPQVSEPVKISSLTQSGRDYAPAASPDGKMLAFASDRDGVDRIWLRQMKGGIEAPLTEGTDGSPQFSPDGTSVLFLRNEGSVASAYRVAVVGGPSRKLLEGVSEARWSPEGNRIAYVRSRGSTAAAITVLGISDVQSGKSTELAQFEGRFLFGIDWSPDGKWISAATTSAVQNTTTNELLIVDTGTGRVETLLDVPTRLSKPAWSLDGQRLVLAQSTSLLGDISGALGRVLLVDPFHDREPTVLFWVQSVWAGSSDIVTFDFLDDDSIVFDEILWRGNLDEIPLDGTAPHSDGVRLTQGRSRDRQPAYSPDGSKIIFSSNRSGNLDLWTFELGSGQLRQLTDDLVDDWDPAFSADGQSIFWSSNRSGHLEIWTAREDGSGAHQLSNDGEDAENPTQTPDGEWVVYASANPLHDGIWRIRSDGSEAERIAEGSYILPEVSPHGTHVVYSANDVESLRNRIFVKDLDTLEVVLTIDVGFLGIQSLIQPGRARWMPDGESFVFVGPTPDGTLALYEQDLLPGQDSQDSRRLLVLLGPEEDIESFGISPDGRSITVSRVDHLRSVKLAEGAFSERR